MASVYRITDSAGRVLYIGSTTDPGRRVREHATAQPWWPSASTIEVLHFATLTEAREVERDMIAREAPAHNRYHNRNVAHKSTSWGRDLNGAAVRQLRRIAGLTVTEAARCASVSQPTWSNWEMGNRRASPANVRGICRVLNIDDEAAILAFPAPLTRAS